ncbi:MAG: hypothetical protein JXA30_19540 [Deltaproteobacteria bacterium]|nr:hypothetical protein [Deltaproteobacteria bacterium]
MAELAPPKLIWTDALGDPGYRQVSLPKPLPEIGDDFDWQQRDFDSFRRAMWQELQLSFPERKRWSPGDVEAVLVELFAAHLDQLSDMADRVSAEASLESARRFESVLKWLDFIGYDPLTDRGEINTLEALKNLYRDKPHEMERDKRRGPAAIRRQLRMASLQDYGQRLEEHPLVLRARAKERWTGSWLELVITVGLWNDWKLDNTLMTDKFKLPDRIKKEVERFHTLYKLRELKLEKNPTIRELLLDYIRAFRMTGHLISLVDVEPVGVLIEVCVTVRDNYFQSEVRREVARVLGRGPDGFFRSGRLAFGQDVQLSDIYGALMPIDGVKNVKIVRFGQAADDPQPGNIPATNSIVMGPDELAVCGKDDKGEVVIQLVGGRRG